MEAGEALASTPQAERSYRARPSRAVAGVTPAMRNHVLPLVAGVNDVTCTRKDIVDVKESRGKKAGDKASTDGRAVRAEANQRFVRETLAARQPQYARMVERAAEAVVRELTQRRSEAAAA